MRWILLLGMIISCGNHSGKAGQVNDSINVSSEKAISTPAQVNPLLFRNCVTFDSAIVDGPDSVFKETLIQKFPGDLEAIKPAQILAIKISEQSVSCGSLGVCQIYKLTLSQDLPEVIPDTLFFLISRTTGKAALFPLATLRPLKLRPQDSNSMVGGTFMSRGKGFFNIYRYNGHDGFDLLFNTADIIGCRSSVPVYNSSLDCISYDPFGLRLEVMDENGDGINDLVFKGKVLSFCRGLETGYGRKDRKPLKETNVRIVFEGAIEKGNPSWRLQDTTVYRVLSGE
jgi:hypothetical protein